ncbi:MAG: hypothetical protein L6406_22915 [Desulfobacterales bacterium]|nr:hypothetical protein [Desulfobacterales bacterium]
MADPTNCSKDWVDVLTALITPTIAIAGIAIAVFQWRLSKVRYKHELFDKRWEQFSAIRDFIGKARTKGKVSRDDEYDFMIATRGCEFLFDDDIKTLVEDVLKKAVYLNTLQEELEGLKEPEERKRNVAHQRETRDWFEEQTSGLGQRFKKFLRL